MTTENRMTEFRNETDSLDKAELPADRLWGAQTQRSSQRFGIGPNLIPSEMNALPDIVVVGGDAGGHNVPDTGFGALVIG
jgi:aspartate ammonia-lyase